MFALCLFAGIRPCVRFGEIVKLKPESVRLDTVIRIEPEVSKLHVPRNATIQPNLAAWLRVYRSESKTNRAMNAALLVLPGWHEQPNMRRRDEGKFGFSSDFLLHPFE